MVWHVTEVRGQEMQRVILWGNLTKRRIGRRSKEDNVKKHGRRMELAQDRVQWRALVSAVLNSPGSATSAQGKPRLSGGSCSVKEQKQWHQLISEISLPSKLTLVSPDGIPVGARTLTTADTIRARSGVWDGIGIWLFTSVRNCFKIVGSARLRSCLPGETHCCNPTWSRYIPTGPKTKTRTANERVRH
jgi:hypothetical protein